MTDLRIRVDGSPAPQGSKRHVGNGRMIESSKAVAPWRMAVAWTAHDAAVKQGWVCADGPVLVSMQFFLQPPQRMPKGRTRPTVKPDIDKLARSTLDALTTAGVFKDDAQVVVLSVSKDYAGERYPVGADICVTLSAAERAS